MTIQMKAIEQYFHVVLFITLYKVVLTLKSVDKTLAYDHSNESYWAVFLCGTVLYAIEGELSICERNPSYDHLSCTLLPYATYQRVGFREEVSERDTLNHHSKLSILLLHPMKDACQKPRLFIVLCFLNAKKHTQLLKPEKLDREKI